MLRSLRNFLNMDRPEHHSTDCLEKEDLRKEVADIPPLRSRTICVQPDKHWHCLEGNLREIAERQGRACMDLSERYDAILR